MKELKPMHYADFKSLITANSLEAIRGNLPMFWYGLSQLLRGSHGTDTGIDYRGCCMARPPWFKRLKFSIQAARQEWKRDSCYHGGKREG